MGMGRLRELAPIVKEALHRTAGVAGVLCCFHVTVTYVCSLARLSGPSMLPTFHEGDVVLVESISSRLGEVGSGDVVLLRSPENPRKKIVKRVKGVGGDVVSYPVNPEKSDEQKTVVVPKGHVWIEGDNLQNSRDSRVFGPVPYALIHSRICFVLSPREDRRVVRSKVL